MLALFDPGHPTTVSADASSFGLGAVLLQKTPSGDQRPVAYASRAMTPTEQRYAQIEKESLALTWACDRFADYLVGLKFHIETDHKPLAPLFSTKQLGELPLRIQRFRMRMMRYHFYISHVPGKSLITADALSRAPATKASTEDCSLQEEVEAYVEATYMAIPATEKRLEEIRRHQEDDEILQLIRMYCQTGWPAKEAVPRVVRPYFPVAAELTIQKGLLLRGSRVVIPASL